MFVWLSRSTSLRIPRCPPRNTDECTKLLRKAGVGHPRGRVYHACFGSPESVAVFDVMVAFDHLRHEATILANVFVDGEVDEAYAAAAASIAEVRERLAAPVPQFDTGEREPARFESNTGEEGFEASVARCVEYIHAGDAYQVVPSQRWTAEAPAEAFSIYRGLRAVNPSPYMYFLDFGDFQIAGASPESLVKVEGRTATQRPIAGTRPRADSAVEDVARAEELLADEKERAEHVMLVDLARNDLGRVCDHGSVTVDELMVVETYSHVLHIVSEVSGTLRADVGPIEALRGACPRARCRARRKSARCRSSTSWRRQARPLRRSVGYLSYSGELDTCIYIRSALIKDGMVHAQAGGGVVADSDPAYERRESEAKAGAVFQAIELARRQGTGHEGPARGQLRLVHLQPRAVPRRARRGHRRRPQRQGHGRRAATAAPTA